MLINELAGENDKKTIGKETVGFKELQLESYNQQLDDLLQDIEVLFNTIKTLYKSTKACVDSLK